MWSVGIILYMLLTGKPPFDGRSDKEVIAQIVQKSKSKIQFDEQVYYKLNPPISNEA